MTSLRYDEAAGAALAIELQAGTELVVLRAIDGTGPTSNGRGGSDGAGGAPQSGGFAGDAGVPGAGGVGGESADQLLARLDPRRLRRASTPPTNLLAVATGASLCGLRPVLELTAGSERDELSWTFEAISAALAACSLLAADAAGSSPGEAGRDGAPGGVTVRIVTGSASRGVGGAFHGALAAFLALPGITVAAPATVPDLYGLMRSAVHAPGPVVLLESGAMAALSGEIGDHAGPVPLGRAELVRPGRHVTVVAARQMRAPALDAAERLGSVGIEAEVIDPRTLAPLDDATVAASLSRTARLLVVQDEPLAAAWGAALIARLASSHFAHLDAPPRLVGRVDPGERGGSPPSAEEIAAAAEELARY